METEKTELQEEIVKFRKIKDFIDDIDLPHYKIVLLLQEISNQVAINEFEIKRIDQGI